MNANLNPAIGDDRVLTVTRIFEAPREKRTQTFLRGVLEAGTI